MWGLTRFTKAAKQILLSEEGYMLAEIINSPGNSVVTSADREIVKTVYFCKVAFTGASVGDRIIKTRSLDVTQATPVTIWTQWHNDTKGTDLSTAPTLANLSSLDAIDGQRLAKEASATARQVMGAVVNNRAANTILGGMFTFQTTVINGIVRLSSLTLASSNPSPTKAFVSAFAFTDAAPSGTNIVANTPPAAPTNSASTAMTITDNSVFAVPYSLLGSRNFAALGTVAGSSSSGTNGVSTTSLNLSQNICTDATGKFYTMFVLNQPYSNIANEVLSSSAEFFE
jgi:hypothetical protein